MNRRIWLSEPYQNGKEMEYINRALEKNEITQFGDNLEEFHRRTSEYVNNLPCLHVNSATAGLHLILRYLGIGAGDYVLCSTLTFAASCNPALYLGANVIFVDSDEKSYNMSPIALKKAISWAKKQNYRIKAAIIVDIYGQPAEYDEILPILQEENIPTVEDAAEAQGSFYKGKKCGTLCDFAVFSYDSNKMITTSGGGTIIAKEQKAIDKMRYWAMQAREPLPYYQHFEYGYQYRMSNILAGIGCAQMQSLDTILAKKQKINERYKESLKNYPVKFMPEIEGCSSNKWLTVMNFLHYGMAEVLGLIDFLEKNNVEARMCWKPMHLQPLYKESPYVKEGEKDVAKTLFESGVCLPSAVKMSVEEQDYVIQLIKNYMDNKKYERKTDDYHLRK